ncbi:sugar ABC transporter substrate-binding protein [Anaerocolumna xylanovorans]|uniref:D-xylose transport system substrate-binding protein n=1 Tax=Anaerocolumna xylanovorans DSM 12503 TaxID=1121345 RepID=A0A1M7Y0K0_9FIRM|nr:substrate-binding domain-containing protein [Anaerocolumna xylanovorans]SHO45157.1 D-xylose transport system substrate-binding protein [Anaerocolumna xylanovorans DSM 12503]
MRRSLLRRTVALGLTVLLLIFAVGCEKRVERQEKPKEDDKMVVGFSLGTLMEDRWIRDRDIFISKAEEENIEVIVNNANKDSDLQYKQVKTMLNQGIDVLVIAPNDSNTEARCVKAAKDKKIPVISYDRLVSNANVDVYISFDNYQVGKIMAEYLTENVPKGGYIIIGGSENDSNSKMLYDGAMKVLEPFIEKGDIKILAKTWIDGWIRESAYDFMREELKSHKNDVKAVICGNDSLAWGAIDALSEAQIAEKVQVTGQDADLVACQRIVTGKQALTVYKPIKDLVKKTVEVCMQLHKGEKIKTDKVIDDGTYEVPYIFIGVQAVTKDNINDTVIKDGFHLYEDVYQTE